MHGIRPWLTILVVLQAVSICGHGVRQGVWTRLGNTTDAFLRMGEFWDSWRSMSVLSCVADCYNRFGICKSLRFDKDFRSCSHLELLADAQNPSVPIQTRDLYVSEEVVICDKTLGFSLYQDGSVTACVFVSENKVNNSIAKEECGGKGGALYTIKSGEKLNIYKNYLRFPDYTWIGLEDLYENASFYWSDGEVFDTGSSMWSVLWNTNEPNRPTEELCVVIHGNSNDTYDTICSTNRLYICERV